MYFILSIILIFVVLFVLNNKVESFTNHNSNNCNTSVNSNSTLTRIDINKYNNNIPCKKNNTSTPFKNVKFYNKYDATMPCQNPSICSEHSLKCMNENTFYYTMDNCVQDGSCRLSEDPVNLFPTKNKK